MPPETAELCQCGHLATDHSGNGIGDRTGCYECDDTEQSGICVCTRFTPPVDEREKAKQQMRDDVLRLFGLSYPKELNFAFDAGWNARDSEVERLNGEIADLKIRVLVDWFEDFADEDNGNYQHVCPDCNIVFYGHKRRIGPCKQCWTKFAIAVVIEHNRRALEEK